MAAVGLRLFASALRNVSRVAATAGRSNLGSNLLNFSPKATELHNQIRCIGSFWANNNRLTQHTLANSAVGDTLKCQLLPDLHSGLLTNWAQCQVQQSRSVIKFSVKKGKRKTVKGVVRRFFFLNWGIWIRPRSGANKKIWKKKWTRRQRIRRHVFVNAQQTRMLKHMTTRYWRRPRFFPDDPYLPYQARTNYKLRYPYR